MSYVGRVDQGVLTNNTDATAKMYRVKFQSGQERTLELSDAAVSHYQRIGVQVTPISHGTQLTDVSIRMRNIERNQSQMGIDMTELGKIDVRQDASIAGYRTELDNALTHRQSNQANITSNTSKIEELFSGQKNIYESIEGKADKGHKHACTNCDKCEWYDIFCKMGNFQSEVGKYAIIAGVGIVAFFILKARLKL
jgi:hypothetical protein